MHGPEALGAALGTQVPVYLFDVYPPHLSLFLSLASQPHRRLHLTFLSLSLLLDRAHYILSHTLLTTGLAPDFIL